jgi:hypothetical protein
MLHSRLLLALFVYQQLCPTLRFWKRGGESDQREAALNEIYASLSATYEAVANLKPEWSEAWAIRHSQTLPPKFEDEDDLPAATIDAVREVRFARSLLQRHRWRSVRQPLFANIEPAAWATLQRRLQMVSPELLSIQDAHVEQLRQDEVDWIARAVEGYDNARLHIRSAERDGEPIERQVASSAYVALHLALQLSDRFIERQRFELTQGD